MPTTAADEAPGFDVDECISKLLEVRGGKPGKMEVPKKNDEPVHWFDKEHEIYARWVNEGRLRVFS